MAWRNSWKGIAAGAVLVLIAGTTFAAFSTKDAGALEVTVYKSPTCGCCTKWIAQLAANGFKVNAHDVADLAQIKLEHGIRRELTACHTALVDEYVIEGHVPAADIRRLLQERPDVVGLAVPGMVIGSPGMEGPSSEPYNVLTFDRDGNTTVFAKH